MTPCLKRSLNNYGLGMGRLLLSGQLTWHSKQACSYNLQTQGVDGGSETQTSLALQLNPRLAWESRDPASEEKRRSPRLARQLLAAEPKLTGGKGENRFPKVVL